MRKNTKVLVFTLFLLFCMFLAKELYAKELDRPLGKIIKEKREVSNFKSVTISGFGTLYIKQGSKEALSIEGESDVISNIKVEVKDNHLFVKLEDRKHQDKEITYYVTMKEIQTINTNGDMKVFSRGSLAAPSLDLTMNGSSKADIKVKVDKLAINIAGNGKLKAVGDALDQIIKIEGAGEFNGKKLLGHKGNIIVNGAGSAEVNVSEELVVQIHGFGKVKYYGGPKIIQETSGGGGEIIPL